MPNFAWSGGIDLGLWLWMSIIDTALVRSLLSHLLQLLTLHGRERLWERARRRLGGYPLGEL